MCWWTHSNFIHSLTSRVIVKERGEMVAHLNRCMGLQLKGR